MSAEHSVKDFDAAVTERRSIRGFKSEPVSRDVLDHIFGLANLAPSNCNTQPWHTIVVSGARRDALRDQLVESIQRGQISLDYPFDGKYDGVWKDRQYDAAYQLYHAMGIARDDKAGRNECFMRNYQLFDAPHVAFLFLPDWSGMREACDLGMYAQTLMLAMTAHGLASCPQTSLGFFADLIRSEFGVDASWKLMFGLSFGYEDTEHDANKCRVGRASMVDMVRFVD